MAKKKKDKEEPTQAEKVKLLAATINAKMNQGKKPKDQQCYIAVADEVYNPFKLRRPTGITSLDIAIKGGWPAGGPSQVAGPERAGKNAICHMTCAEVQRIYKEDANICWTTTEFQLDKSFGRLLGSVIPPLSRDS